LWSSAGRSLLANESREVGSRNSMTPIFVSSHKPCSGRSFPLISRQQSDRQTRFPYIADLLLSTGIGVDRNSARPAIQDDRSPMTVALGRCLLVMALITRLALLHASQPATALFLYLSSIRFRRRPRTKARSPSWDTPIPWSRWQLRLDHTYRCRC